MPNKHDPEKRDLWRQRVDSARRDYERAREESARALERAACNPTDRAIDALSELHSREAAALDEYMRVLRVFHRLVVLGASAAGEQE